MDGLKNTERCNKKLVLYLPHSLFEKLNEVAMKRGVGKSTFIRLLLAEMLEEQTKMKDETA